MCVIIIKPEGQAMPSRRELKLAFIRNHDGCGFASTRHHYKSLDFDDFYAHLSKVGKDEACIIHFRLATHGSVSKANCHPFYDKGTRTWFAHNGILAIDPFKGKTDSETAFRLYLAPTIRRHGLYSRELRFVAEDIIGGSKFAFIQDGQLKAFGTFYEHKGCYYSNLYHLNLFSCYNSWTNQKPSKASAS